MGVDGGAHQPAQDGRWPGPLGRALEGARPLADQTFRRRQDADAFRRSVEAEELRGVVVDVRRSSTELETFAKDWLATRRRPDGRPLTAATRALYRDLLDRHILPTFGAARLASIQSADVRRWHGDLADRVSPLQAAKSYRLLRTILNTAVRDGVLAVNPCNIEGAGVERSAERPLIDAEAVFDLAEAIDPRYRALVLLIAFGPGSRRGEMRAYRRRHLDLAHARIHTEVQEHDGAGPSAAKNDPARWTTLPEFLVDELERHLDAYAQPDPDGYIFTGPKGGPISEVHWYKSFHAAREAIGMPELHPHDLRHAAGTFFAQQGATTKEIMARLGHRSRAAADRYQHAATPRDAELAARLNDAAERARSRITVFPCGQTRPLASNLNYVAATPSPTPSSPPSATTERSASTTAHQPDSSSTPPAPCPDLVGDSSTHPRRVVTPAGDSRVVAETRDERAVPGGFLGGPLAVGAAGTIDRRVRSAVTLSYACRER